MCIRDSSIPSSICGPCRSRWCANGWSAIWGQPGGWRMRPRARPRWAASSAGCRSCSRAVPGWSNRSTSSPATAWYWRRRRWPTSAAPSRAATAGSPAGCGRSPQCWPCSCFGDDLRDCVDCNAITR